MVGYFIFYTTHVTVQVTVPVVTLEFREDVDTFESTMPYLSACSFEPSWSHTAAADYVGVHVRERRDEDVDKDIMRQQNKEAKGTGGRHPKAAATPGDAGNSRKL